MDAALSQGATLAGLLAGLGAALLFLALVGLAAQVHKRVRLLSAGRSAARRTLADYQSAASASRTAGRPILPKPLRAALSVLRRPSPATIVPPAAGAVMAVLCGDGILGTYLVLLGAGLALYLAYRQTLLYHQRVGDDVHRLIDAFAALYVVNPATFAALELAMNRLGAGILKEATEGAVREYGATRDAQGALARLYAVGDPYLSRFALILAQAGEQGTDEIARLVGRPGSPPARALDDAPDRPGRLLSRARHSDRGGRRGGRGRLCGRRRSDVARRVHRAPADVHRANARGLPGSRLLRPQDAAGRGGTAVMSTETGLRLVFALAAFGTWLVLAALGYGAADLVRRIARLRVSRITVRLRAYEQGQAALPEQVLYGYPDLPWDTAGVVLAIGLFLVLMATTGWPMAALAGLTLRVPHLLRRTFRKEGQVRLKLLVRDFVDDLREAYAIYGSLGRALDALVTAAEAGGRRDAVALALRARARTRTTQIGADEILAQMARDLRSEAMQEAADQVRLGLAAGMDVGQALAAVADNLSELIAAEVNIRLQAAPNTYLMPMVICMFGPLLVLVLYPLALRIIALLGSGPAAP
jgi:uncharacterized protein YoaH (UPF0181 family)